MPKYLFIALLGILPTCLWGQPYWQQQANHTIHVTLDPNQHTLDGHESIEYINRSPDTLPFIWMHIWPNAYKNDRTAFSEQLLLNRRTDFYFSEETERGYINRLDFRINGNPAQTIDHPSHQDIIKVILPSPLPPGRSATIETPFHVQLPKYFSRSGYSADEIAATQWFPKPAVYDNQGWHEMPYLDQGEFYSEFGDYDVTITAPEGFIIAATGNLLDSSGRDALQTWHYRESNIHDFAFFASKNFQVERDTLNLHTHSVEVISYHRKDDLLWKNSVDMIKRAVRSKSELLGEYPYLTVKAVQHFGLEDGGMEYPTITYIGNTDSESELESLINHEVGHNWFYGILASNERDFPWMDEGMNTYYDARYRKEVSNAIYSSGSVSNRNWITRRIPDDMEGLILATLASEKLDQPIATASDDFSKINYAEIAYYKTGIWMNGLETLLGKEKFDSMMHAYFSSWQYRHPGPDDFKSMVSRFYSGSTDSIFGLLHQTGLPEPVKRKGLKCMAFGSLRETMKHNYLFIAPAFGYNVYDKFMAGMLFHNYTLPLPRLRYFAAPMYATGSGRIRAIGGLQYSAFPAGNNKLTFGINGAMFSENLYIDSTGKKNYLDFRKIAPFVKYDFAKKGSISHTLEWKTYLITEKTLLFSYDSAAGYRISYPDNPYYINQLKLTRRDNRVLYPYEVSLEAEQGKDFMKTSVNWEAFFNYGEKKKGGLTARVYAGKFFYLGEKSILKKYYTDRYHINLTGPDGYEDYTYSGYFLGRNEYEGMASQQILKRDGFFKVRTNMLSNKIGKTDNWLAALNLSSTIPDHINPLSVLPVKIPLRVFLDIGTFDEAWKKGAETGKFLYDAGLEISLAGDAIHIYIPLAMSRVFRDYVNSTVTGNKFLKTISFSIDLNRFSVSDLMRKLN